MKTKRSFTTRVLSDQRIAIPASCGLRSGDLVAVTVKPLAARFDKPRAERILAAAGQWKDLPAMADKILWQAGSRKRRLFRRDVNLG